MKKTLLGVRALMSVPKDNPGLVKAQYIALSRQLPMMYFILLINTLMLAGTHFAVAPRWLVVYCPLIMTLFGVIRAAEWMRTRGRTRTPEQMLAALKRTNMLAPFVAVAFTAWSLALFPYGDSYAQAHVAFYMAITVIGCIFCMMHLLPAALATTAVVNTAFVVFFASTNIITFIATAIDVLLVSIAMLIILKAQYADFTRLVNMQAQTAKLSEENLHLANQDSLTGLANRRQFFSRLDTLLSRAREQEIRLAVGLIDLDGFKPVNDLYGHSIGDKLLCQVGQRLTGLLDEDVHLARLGGDEFGLIITQAMSDDQLRTFGEKICASMREPFLLVDIPIQISASLGIATFPDQASDATQVYEYADYALYQSKRHRPGTVCLFSAAHRQQLNREGLTEQALRRADLDDEFHVVFQPIVDVHSQQTVAFEALARWESPELGNVPPSEFIPIAERVGMVNRLTVPLLSKALDTAASWPEGIRLSFNLSAHDCGSEDAAQQIVELIKSSRFDPACLDLEITETAVIQDLPQTQRAISRFRELGCGISLDDFGTGYSSLSQIHALSLTKLKVDRTFVTNIHLNPASFKIVKSLIALCQDMKLECIVEGVETAAELDALKNLGCAWAQGYLFSKPMRASDISTWLEGEQLARVQAV
ncbi:putative bifunctional diguanylate cyclase/phosphodiesterase [Pseudomonas cichorii]|uniref:Diguanylate cyclase n=1 Tax=Pseudomonas cichorii TaxID=36746 RepID=A0ABQ1DUX7_PSECI|nr:EAL domain-containing protein [Pseudomonas cichorii]AHF66317.1 diguanylate cyclase/phosphodiesterase [Pseudomonas cichorii JBC1]QVE18264.1 EAL domain-containing protein [Pseudomonas cichorii]GFM94749.1 diguanylate cyclase [Pseudomonas cichorii]SDO39816.1 diguanylate cyclase/phosphodiesterase [Pseudomonas cichorii]